VAAVVAVAAARMGLLVEVLEEEQEGGAEEANSRLPERAAMEAVARTEASSVVEAAKQAMGGVMVVAAGSPQLALAAEVAVVEPAAQEVATEGAVAKLEEAVSSPLVAQAEAAEVENRAVRKEATEMVTGQAAQWTGRPWRDRHPQPKMAPRKSR
jgi:hypothetical protein